MFLTSVADNSRPRATLPMPPATAPAVRAADLGKDVDGRAVLRGISLELAVGSFLGVLGSNGAGKSTFLKVLATLTRPSHGRLEMLGRPVLGDDPALRARIGMIGHQLMLYRDLSARENLEFFGRLYAVAHPRRRADELLEFVGLADRATDPVRSLSRGMAQRVAIARALVHGPDLLLADEPFTGLDTASARLLECCLRDLSDRGKTIIMANHDPLQTLRLADRVVVLRGGELVADLGAGALERSDLVALMEGQP